VMERDCRDIESFQARRQLPRRSSDIPPDVANFPRQLDTFYNTTASCSKTIEMSFQSLSKRLAALQESNTQLKDLIERLATIKFQPESIPLDNQEGNVVTELASEIQQTLKDQGEDLELMQEDVNDLDSGREGSELRQQKDRLDQAVTRAIKELKGYASDLHGDLSWVTAESDTLLDARQPSAELS